MYRNGLVKDGHSNSNRQCNRNCSWVNTTGFEFRTGCGWVGRAGVGVVLAGCAVEVGWQQVCGGERQGVAGWFGAGPPAWAILGRLYPQLNCECVFNPQGSFGATRPHGYQIDDPSQGLSS